MNKLNLCSAEEAPPYLSVVAASRNDDHGGDPLIRTQIFITNFARQCEKYRLRAELIIVDWNPVPGRPGLAAVLNLPTEATYFRGRVVTVPTALHQRLKYADRLPLFQMIAKNVGIRRAAGQFILATNIDIIFSDELIRFIALQRLDAHKQYRVDRYDIQSGLTPEASLDEALTYAWSSPIRTHRRYHPERLVQQLYGEEPFRKSCVPNPKFREINSGVTVVQEQGVWQVRPDRSVHMSHLHTNACGDFTLISREGWDVIRGYPEFAAYSFNIDSMGVVAAHYAGYEEVSLLPPCVCFHIEHGIGSGWTPEGEGHLFKRLEKAGVLNPEWPVLTPLVNEMRKHGRALEFNYSNWGLVEFDLPEQDIGDTASIASSKLERLALQSETHPVSAIQPAYDLDRLTLVHERRVMADLDLTIADDISNQVLYIPDSDGCYWEESSLAYRAPVAKATTVIFRLGQFACQFPLRFDPCQGAGLVSISSITVLDLLNNCVVLRLDGRHASKLIIGGTARWGDLALPGINALRAVFSKASEPSGQLPLQIISTGCDPRLIFPALSKNVGFPLEISIRIKFIPHEFLDLDIV